MSVICNNQLAGASGQGSASAPPADFSIKKSLRFNSEDSAYLSRTPSSASNRRTWTWSGWVKRSKFGTKQIFFGVQGSNNSEYSEHYFASDDKLYLRYGYNSVAEVRTTQVFSDPSAWLHIVIAFDVTQTANVDKLKLYINGSEVTDFSTDTRSSLSNQDYGINRTGVHKISGEPNASSGYLDAGLAEVHFIDGQALAATDFGEFDSNNAWNAKQYSGTYGTNGFHLDFDNASNLGNDAAGSNDFTANNFHGTAPGITTANRGVNVLSYVGNAGTNNVTGLDFQPDFVWIKNRESNFSHMLFDSVRGVQKVIYSNSTSAEQSAGISLTAFNSNGFTVGSANEVNENSKDIAAFCWKAGGAASSNSDGSITSSISANNTYGFSIVKYIGATGVQTVGHGLAETPKFIIAKNIDTSSDWIVYHASLDGSNPEDKFLRLNHTDAPTTSADYWGAGGVTNSVFGLDNSILINSNGHDAIAYCWSEKGGYSKFNSFSGNGAAGNKIVTGFRPKLVIIKRTSNISGSHMGWVMTDSTRGGTKRVSANHNAQENDGPINSNNSPNDDIIFNADGFTLNSGASATNGNGETYVYAAFADLPHSSEIDSLIDTPMNYDADSGNNGGNYCTWNPLNKGSSITTSDGNLKATLGSTGHVMITGTMGITSGKYYWEVETNGWNTSNQGPVVGVVGDTHDISTQAGGSPSVLYRAEGVVFANNSSVASSQTTYTTGDIIGVALDADNNNIIWYKNNSQMYQYTSLDSTVNAWLPAWKDSDGGGYAIANFGQRPFAYTPPAGYKSLCTQNLPDPTIADGSTAFDAKLYTGNSSTQSISSLNFQPDLVWIKVRNSGSSSRLFDAVRGATKHLSSNTTDAEGTAAPSLTGFTSNGFSLGQNNDGQTNVNQSSGNYVAWTWASGDNNVSNSNGSMASTVRANPSAGFSICKYTSPNNSADQSFGHGLNAKPDFVIIKNLDSNYSWDIYHSSLGYNASLVFGTGSTRSGAFASEPTTTLVSTKHQYTHNSTDEYSALCWSAVEGYSSFGIYTGNGSADGPFVYTGHRSKFLLIKATSITGEDWVILDTEREPYNSMDSVFFANTSSSELTNTAYKTDILSNGFKLRGSNPRFNQNNATYIYASFAEHPFKTARAR